MSRKYTFLNKKGLYFVSFATVNWIDVFLREVYTNILVESLNYWGFKKALNCFDGALAIHVHLILRAQEGNPDALLGRIEEYTAKQLLKSIRKNSQESRKEWWMLKRQARKA